MASPLQAAAVETSFILPLKTTHQAKGHCSYRRPTDNQRKQEDVVLYRKMETSNPEMDEAGKTTYNTLLLQAPQRMFFYPSGRLLGRRNHESADMGVFILITCNVIPNCELRTVGTTLYHDGGV